LQEQERRKENNKAKHYIPNGKAEEFIKMVGNAEHFVNMFIAGNGVGKSASGAVILTNIIFGKQNDWFDYPLFNNWPYEKRARIISDPTTIKEKIIPELRKWFPANEAKNIPDANFDESKEGKNYICKINTNTGWTIDIMSTEQDAKEFESADIGLVWIDEPMPKDKFMATLARGRLGMILIWTLTPLFFAAWIKDWKDENTYNGIAGYVEAEMEDNCIDHGIRGILKHENIMRIANSYPEDEKEARVFGKFGHLIGRVHKKFNRRIHVIKPFAINVRDYTTYKAIDTHPRVPDHVLYCSVDRSGHKYFTGEMLSEGGAEIFSERMKAYENSMGFRLEDRIIDLSAFNKNHHNDSDEDERSFGDQLEQFEKCRYIRGSKDLMSGIKRTNDALDYELKNGVFIKEPEIYIFDTLKTTIVQMDNYVWEEWKGSSKDSKKLSGHPRDKDDHMPENMHRLLLHDLQFINYQLSSTYRSEGGGDYEREAREMDPYD